MDASAIASHITDINKLSAKDAQEILPMLEKFPYSSTLYILYLKALANNNSLEFESQLKLAAAHVSDREHLYHLINSETKISAKNQKELKEEVVVDEEKVQIEASDTLEIEKELEEKHTAQDQEEEEEEEEEEVVSIVSAQDEVEVMAEETKDLSAEQTSSETEEEIISDSEDESNESIEESSLDQEIFSQAIATAFDVKAEEKIDTPIQKEASFAVENITENEIPEDMSFIDWLQFKKSGEIVERQEDSSSDLEEKDVEEKDIPEETLEGVEIEEKRMSKKEVNDLLDRFISEQPSISKPVKDTFNPTSNATNSVEESAEIVSETLAQIHVMQGNYGKAIKAYKQLSLLYPEKKVFFASQIKKIESKLD